MNTFVKEDKICVLQRKKSYMIFCFDDWVFEGALVKSIMFYVPLCPSDIGVSVGIMKEEKRT